ncbi:MAG: aldo/keto reductase [Caulobacteraceae bacterium]
MESASSPGRLWRGASWPATASARGGETSRAATDPFAAKLYYQEADFAVVDAVSTVAKAKGLSNMQVALAWVLAKPGVTAPIIGASKANHIHDALSALEVELTEDEIKMLEAPYRTREIGDHD